MLNQNGDTDTNAAIVGGLLGAATGRDQLPSHMIKALLACDAQQGRKRPDWLIPKTAVESMLKEVFDNAPETL